MMNLTDTHVHFDSFAEDGNIDGILQNARETGVNHCIAIGGSAEANRRALSLAEQHGDRILCACGYDRDQIGVEIDENEWREQLDRDAVAAVGECGLDYHYGPDTAAAQKRLLERNLQMAMLFKLPVVVHSRDADEDTLGLLREYADTASDSDGELGVLHCFTLGKEMARSLLELGFYISFSGIVTFKNAGDLREVAKYVPSDRLLIETDAPYLAPEPKRGQRNEPSLVVHVAERLAKVRGMSLEKIAETTTENAARLFRRNPEQ